jgi:hypothetical protein
MQNISVCLSQFNPWKFPVLTSYLPNAGFFWNQYWQCVYLYWSAKKTLRLAGFWFVLSIFPISSLLAHPKRKRVTLGP